MKAFLVITSILSLSLVAFSNQKSKNIAKVKLVKGSAFTITPSGKKEEIRKGLSIKEGAIIETSAKSFVRLRFIDKSSMNIGANSKLKVEKFSTREAGVINVLSGKIRSEVTKNYLEKKSKLFVKSKNAVMGIRGTDFLFSTNPKSNATTAVLFEGSVVFKKLNKGDRGKDLESLVNKGRKINPGQFSVATNASRRSTVPAKLSSKQFKQLFKNKNFEIAGSKKKRKLKSIVPPGLSGELVKSKSEDLSDKVKTNKKGAFDIVASKGFVKGEDVKPADGSLLHVDTGLVIPVGIDSSFDDTKNEWVSPSVGTVNTSGEYLPPEGFKVSDDGKLLREDGSGLIKEVLVEIKPLDKVKPLNELPTIEPIQDRKKRGPSPAGGFEDEKLDSIPTPVDEAPQSSAQNLSNQTNNIQPENRTKTNLQINIGE